VFDEDVMPQLIAGAVHASEGVRAAAFGMIANVLKALPALGLHDAPLPQIASVILGALERETSVAALSAELGALARFCGYHRGLDLPFTQEILAACDHFGCSPERAHQLAVVACYRDLAESGCMLSERASAFLCGVLQKRPDERLFFKVLASIDTFLDAFPIAIVTAMQAYLSVCDIDALAWKERRAVFALACRIPDAVAPFYAPLLNRALVGASRPFDLRVFPTSELDPATLTDHEIYVDAARNVAIGVAVDDLQERAAMLLDLRWFILAAPQAALDQAAPIRELGRALLAAHIWDTITPAFLKFLRAAVTVCEGFADEIFEPLIVIVVARPFVADVNARFTRAVTAIAAALADPEAWVETLVGFARDQLWRAQESLQIVDDRCAAIEDVRNYQADFESCSIELGLLKLLRSLARWRSYANLVGNLLHELYQTRTPFLRKMALVLAADYMKFEQPDPVMLAETVAFCVFEFEQGTEFRYISFTVLGIGFLQRVFDFELFQRFFTTFVEMLRIGIVRPVCSAGLVAILMGVIGYDGIRDMSAPIALLMEQRESFSGGLATCLFPDNFVLAITTLLQKIGPLSVTVGWHLTRELRKSSEISDEAREVVVQALRVFEEHVSELQTTAGAISSEM
jgi:hypothetical protein